MLTLLHVLFYFTFYHKVTCQLLMHLNSLALAHSQIATPSTPETLHINMSSVNITWTYSDAPTDPPTQFIVQIRSQSFGDNKFHNLTTPLSKLYYVYTGLVYGVFYQFRVIAVRNGSFSEPSPSSFIFDNGMTGNITLHN